MLHEEIEKAEKKNGNLAFVHLNIDRFRYVNETLGHEAGDYILSVIAKRMKGILEDKHLIGRISGDEFALLLKGITRCIACGTADAGSSAMSPGTD